MGKIVEKNATQSTIAALLNDFSPMKAKNNNGVIKRNCDNCGREYVVEKRNHKRGWGLCCSKSCAATKREKSKPGYNPQRVAKNNVRRALWNEKGIDENLYGVYKGKRTTEGYKIYGETAVDEWGDPVYTIDPNDDTHPFSEDAFN